VPSAGAQAPSLPPVHLRAPTRILGARGHATGQPARPIPRHSGVACIRTASYRLCTFPRTPPRRGFGPVVSVPAACPGMLSSIPTPASHRDPPRRGEDGRNGLIDLRRLHTPGHAAATITTADTLPPTPRLQVEGCSTSFAILLSLLSLARLSSLIALFIQSINLGLPPPSVYGNRNGGPRQRFGGLLFKEREEKGSASGDRPIGAAGGRQSNQPCHPPSVHNCHSC